MIDDPHVQRAKTDLSVLQFFSKKLNYGYIFSFPNNFKFDHRNICTNFLIKEQKIINNCSFDMLISLDVEIFCVFEVRPDDTYILVTRDNV